MLYPHRCTSRQVNRLPFDAAIDCRYTCGMSEKNTQNAALLLVGARHDVMIWRNQTGKFLSMDGQRVVKVGNPGAADAIGVVAVTITPDMVGKTIGVAIAPEFKARRGKQADEQKDWQAAFERRGGVYRLIRQPEELVTMVEDVKHGRW